MNVEKFKKQFEFNKLLLGYFIMIEIMIIFQNEM